MKPYCPGTNCPLAGSCARFKSQIDVKKDIHFSEPPYKHDLLRCGFYVKPNEDDKLSAYIKTITDGDQN